MMTFPERSIKPYLLPNFHRARPSTKSPHTVAQSFSSRDTGGCRAYIPLVSCFAICSDAGFISVALFRHQRAVRLDLSPGAASIVDWIRATPSCREITLLPLQESGWP